MLILDNLEQSTHTLSHLDLKPDDTRSFEYKSVLLDQLNLLVLDIFRYESL